MKAADIEFGHEYLAGVDGVSRYGVRAKCRVIEQTAKASDIHSKRAQRSGAKLWLVEWLAPYRSDRWQRFKVGDRTTIPSAQILELWTDEHEAKIANEVRWESEADALEKRLCDMFRLVVADDRRVSDEPTLRVAGQKTPTPSYTLNRQAAERILAWVEGITP